MRAHDPFTCRGGGLEIFGVDAYLIRPVPPVFLGDIHSCSPGHQTGMESTLTLKKTRGIWRLTVHLASRPLLRNCICRIPVQDKLELAEFYICGVETISQHSMSL